MAGERSPNMQDTFLNSARKQRVPVTVYLTSGVKLQGVIGSFDNFCLVLRRGNQAQLVYKHAIATIVPSGPLTLHEDREKPRQEDESLPAQEEEQAASSVYYTTTTSIEGY